MSKEMLINVSEGEECRIALLEDGRLEELYMERTSATSHVGNIYKGRVTNVEASIQAAFVDFGLGRNGFLHISDLMPTYFGRNGGDIQESVGRKLARRDRPPIQRCLRRGDEIIVQIIKEGIGTKGPTLSTYVSIPGRIIVMMPGMSKFGVSRKIEDEDERRRLRGILDSLKPIEDVGFIIRTAGIGKTKTEIQRDLTYLTRLWQNIEKKRLEPAPVELYTEGDLVTRTVRDVFTTDLDRIVVDNVEVAKRVKEFFKIAMPRTKSRVELYEGAVPLFHQAGLERELEMMYSRHVPLPSGGSLVIDSTEAVVAIDVNSGKFRDHSDAEMTAFKTDMEAADEIPRQLKLRDLGGVIICDFIDLRYERNRRELEKRLHDNFKNDRAKTKVLRMSQFGIIELTRQRMRPSLKRSIYFDCPHCKGSGLVKTPESMSLDVMRRLAIAAHDLKVARIELTVCADVGVYVLNKKRAQLTDLEADTKKRIIVRQDASLGLDEVKFELFDSRDGKIYLEELGMSPNDAQEASRRRQQPAAPGRRDNRNDRGRPQPPRQQQQAKRLEGPAGEEEEDRDDLDSAEDAVEDREESRDGQSASAAVELAAASAPPAAPARPEPRPPIGRIEAKPFELGDEFEEEESSVIEVDEPNEPLGEGPLPYEEDRYDRNRQRGQRNDSRGDQRNEPRRDQRNDQRNQPRNDQRTDQRNDQRGDQRNDRGRPHPDQRRDQQRAAQPPRPPLAPKQNRAPVVTPPGTPPGTTVAPAPSNVAGAGEGEGGGRRRRRRRGRRGRGRNGAASDLQGQPIGANDSAEGQPFENGSAGDEHDEADDRDSRGNSTNAAHDDQDPRDDDRGNTSTDARRDRSPRGTEASETDSGTQGNVDRLEAIFETEDAEQATLDAAAAGNADAVVTGTGAGEATEGELPRKRRRRRGGRRHRRNRDDAVAGTSSDDAADGEQPIDEAATESSEETSVPDEAEAPADVKAEAVPDEAPAKPKRRRAAPKTAAAKRPARASRKAPASAAAAEPAPAPPPVVRTGSTDRHLVLDDVPVDPEPIRSFSSYGDLDAIPEDLE